MKLLEDSVDPDTKSIPNDAVNTKAAWAALRALVPSDVRAFEDINSSNNVYVSDHQ